MCYFPKQHVLQNLWRTQQDQTACTCHPEPEGGAVGGGRGGGVAQHTHTLTRFDTDVKREFRSIYRNNTSRAEASAARSVGQQRQVLAGK